MTVLIFPSNPQNGDTYTAPNGTLYTYDGVKWVVTTTTITAEQSINFVQDAVAPIFTNIQGNGISFTYDSATNVLSATVSGGGAANLGDFKINGHTLGTVDAQNPDGWGTYSIGIDPGGESWAGVYIPSVGEQQTGGTLQIFNTNSSGGRIQVNTYDGLQLSSARGVVNFGTDMEFPGAPSHFHIAFDGSNSRANVNELFFGDDFNYLRLISSGQGVEIGTNDRVGGPQRNIQFLSNGRIFFADDSQKIQNGVVTKATNSNVPNGVATVVFRSSEYYVPSVKLVISVEANEGSGAWHSQACEAVIAHRCFDTGTEPVMVVFGVVHTSTEPLVTFTVRRDTDSYIEVVAMTTPSATSPAWVRVQSTEFFTND